MKHEFVKRVYPSNLNYISEKLIKKSKNKNINSLKRNISPNSENNINKNFSNNHSSNHTEITNSQNFLLKTNYSNVSSNYNSLVHYHFQTNFSEGENTTSSQSIFNKTYLTDYHKTYFNKKKKQRNQENFFSMNLNFEGFKKNYRPAIKNERRKDSFTTYVNYDREKVLDVRNKIHNYLTEELHKKVKSINSFYHDKNYFDNNIFSNEDKQKQIIDYNKEIILDKKIMCSTMASSERKEDINSFNKKTNSKTKNRNNNIDKKKNERISQNFDERKKDLKKFLSFTKNISDSNISNDNSNEKQNKNPVYNKNIKLNKKKEYRRKMFCLNYNNLGSSIGNYNKLKFNNKNISSNNFKRNNNSNKMFKIEKEKKNDENIINYNNYNINNNNIINHNNININEIQIKSLNKDIILTGYNIKINNEVNDMMRLLGETEKNDLSFNKNISYDKSSFRSNFDESDLQIKQNNQELIEEKLKVIKLKMNQI
jgi:hypothetical protein